jgi:DNA-binding transcriptional MerR regulator
MKKWDDGGLFPWEDDESARPATPEPVDTGAAATQDDGDLFGSSSAPPKHDADTSVEVPEPGGAAALPVAPPAADSSAAVAPPPREPEPPFGPPVGAAEPAREPEPRSEPPRVEPASAEPASAEPASAEPARTEPPRADSPPRAEPQAQSRPLVRKEYYAISEVSDLVGLPAHVLRYWESQFSVLNPSKNRSGNRVYQRKEIKLILLVKQLLHEEKYTVEGAKQKLEQLRRGGDMAEATRLALDEQMVRVLREDLMTLSELLKMDAE